MSSEKSIVKLGLDILFESEKEIKEIATESEIRTNIELSRYSWGENEGIDKKSKWSNKDTDKMIKYYKKKRGKRI